ncbi:hypothetical protein BCD64_19680 [Nostoc sp. MBR 210]|nr:hypothetical protein BCD64_19680 [Nostoc sp. MBR 210]
MRVNSLTTDLTLNLDINVKVKQLFFYKTYAQRMGIRVWEVWEDGEEIFPPTLPTLPTPPYLFTLPKPLIFNSYLPGGIVNGTLA